MDTKVSRFLVDHEETIVKLAIRVVILSVAYRAGYRAGARNAMSNINPLEVRHIVANDGKEFLYINGKLLEKVK